MNKNAETSMISEDSSQWIKDIITRFHNEYPELVDQEVSVSFNQKDDKLGSAVGSMTISKWGIVLPIIIREFNLYPMDVAVAGGKIMPFNKETVEILMSNKGAFSGVSAGTDDPSQLRRVFGRGLESIEKISEATNFEILDGLNGQIDAINRENVVNELKKLSFDDFVVEKVASVVEFPPNFYTVEKLGEWDYKIRMGRRGEDVEWSEVVDEANLEIFRDKMEKIGAVEGNPAHFELAWEKTAVFAAKMVDFDGTGVGLDLEYDKDGNYTISSGNFEERTAESADIDEILGFEKKIESGDYGLFKFADGSVSKPLSIEEISEDGVYSLFDGLDMVKVGFLDIESIQKEEDGSFDADYYYPSNTKFIKLGKLVEDFNDIEQVKLAESYAILKDGEYNFYGGDFEKIASKNLGFDDARWLWLKMGGTDEEFSKISEDKRYFIQSNLELPKKDEFSGEYSNLLKIAADTGSERTVDAMLSLNFMNKKNIKYFVEKIPLFESAASELAYLLIGVRLGMEQFSESDVKDAMDSLSVVIKNLYQLETYITENKK